MILIKACSSGPSGKKVTHMARHLLIAEQPSGIGAVLKTRAVQPYAGSALNTFAHTGILCAYQVLYKELYEEN